MTKLIMNKSISSAARRPAVTSSAAHSVTSNGVRSLLLSFLLSAFSLLLLSSCDCADCQEKVVPQEKAFFNVTPNHLLFTDEARQKTFTVSSSMDWTLITMPPSYTYSITKGKPGLMVVTVTAADGFTGGLPVTVWVQASNGDTKPVLLEYTFGPGPEVSPEDVIPYVGAFWRANQTGERIIRLKDMNDKEGNRGAWSATVVWLDDRWEQKNECTHVVLKNVTLTELESRGIYGATPGNAEDYQVAGDALMVSGMVNATTPDILFRIGLKNKFSESPACELNHPNYTTTWPARYGLVKVSYANHKKSYLMYLRQGEGDDYVMRPQDFGPNGESWGSPNPRPKAARFSPYNLTAATLNAQVGINGAGPNPGIFTEYPTQAGAYFHYTHPSCTRYAWDPYTVGTPPGWLNWSLNEFLFFFQILHESCPTGYHRPYHGSRSDNYVVTMSESEFQPSLFPLNSDLGQAYTAWGYYADGFFDRFAKGDVSSVCTTSASVAYMGQLIINPENKASLFFPAAGRRDPQLRFAGSHGIYHSASMQSSDYCQSWVLFFPSWVNYSVSDFGTMNSGMTYHPNYLAAPIRCVRNAPVL